jgi:hypothetical protein
VANLAGISLPAHAIKAVIDEALAPQSPEHPDQKPSSSQAAQDNR